VNAQLALFRETGNSLQAVELVIPVLSEQQRLQSGDDDLVHAVFVLGKGLQGDVGVMDLMAPVPEMPGDGRQRCAVVAWLRRGKRRLLKAYFSGRDDEVASMGRIPNERLFEEAENACRRIMPLRRQDSKYLQEFYQMI